MTTKVKTKYFVYNEERKEMFDDGKRNEGIKLKIAK